jgi:multiple sugar transport system substrate-binding protein
MKRLLGLRSLVIGILVFLPLMQAIDLTAPRDAAAAQVAGEITHMQWNASPPTDQAIENAARAFEASHPGTKINMTLIPFDEYQQKVALQMSAGDPPDVFQMPPNVMRWVEAGAVIPLDDYIASDPVLSDAAQTRTWANDMTRFDGEHVFGTQAGALCSMQLYYNRDLFDAAGVDYPTADWTWDDFRTAAQALTIQGGDRTTQWGADLGYLLAGWDGGWQTVAASNGANIMDTNFNPTELRFDDPAVISSWQFMQDLIYKDKVAPSPAVTEALSEAGGPFLSGTVAMVADGCWMLPSYKEAGFNIGMAPLPQGTAGRVSPVWYAGGYLISEQSENKDLAWEWLRWLAVDPESNEIQAGTGLNCGAPMVIAFDELYASAWQDVPGGDACVTSLEGARFFQIFTPNWQEISDTIIDPNWDKFLNGSISAQELSDAITEPTNQQLD